MATTLAASGKEGRQAFRKRLRDSLKWYPFILPNAVIFVIFNLSCWFILGYLSLNSWDMLTPPRFVGLKNVVRLTSDKLLAKALENTFLYAAMFVPTLSAGSLIVAIIVNQALFGYKVFRSIYFLPVVTSITVLAILWARMLSPRAEGPVNYILSLVGVPPQQWLVDLDLALPSVVGLSLWSGFGYYMVIWLAGLQGIPSELVEAAKVDGASGLQIEWYITLPLLRPTAIFVIMIATIRSLQVFGSIYILTGGGPVRATTTVVWLVWSRAFELGKMGLASVTAILLFLIILVITMIQRRLLRMREDIY